MSKNNKIQSTWHEMTPLERLCVSVIVQAYRDRCGRLGGGHYTRKLYDSPLAIIDEAEDFFAGTRFDGWCCAMGADGPVVLNGIRQLEGR
jgi:hypothetical protein